MNIVTPSEIELGHKSSDKAPWWKGAVIYHIYPRSFYDSNGDGIGDLRGCIEKLDHIASLGVDAIWLSPFFKSPQADYGYDISDYKEIDPTFGTLDDFDDLVEQAHSRGLKIIIDQVYAHTSDQHAWFEESRQSRKNVKSDWYVWADPKIDGMPPNNWQSVFGGPAWEWDARRQQYFMHNFLKEQPQLNVHNLDVQNAILEIMRFWIDRGVDGFRMDAINFAMHNRAMTDNPPSNLERSRVTRPFDMQKRIHNQSQPEIPLFMERIRKELDKHGEIFTVAEIGGDEALSEMRDYTYGDKRLNSAYSFDFLDGPPVSADKVRGTLGNWIGEDGEGWPSWAFENHDAPRAVSRWAKPENRWFAARNYMMLLLSLRGNAFIYQGEELGLPQGEVAFEHLKDPEAIANWPRTLGRDGARVPMPWNKNADHAGFTTGTPWIPVDPKQAELAVDTQTDDIPCMLRFTKYAMGVRKRTLALRLGSMTFMDTHNSSVLAFMRRHDEEHIMCVYNFSDKHSKWNHHLGKGWKVMFSHDGMSDGWEVPHDLPAYSAYWAKLTK
ncbi:alpha-glucosidase family protein [Hirschia baltica]|uniref:Alpha amylase catalytic region n=1 Tax=Hirschia baltica (strain ATCC 49814 / DSM 5838 / IFAM 1418) TaxID=582402 RepID=C6XKJ2_HIRBI|nr:alpha-glucosidase family protein [Hirschia baltica]ACT59559.1 alpha amylase catalytic region [Hirschia baltica ATCC 49814]